MIYLVEDDESVRDMVCYALRSSGFSVTGFENASLFWRAIKDELPKLIILDIMLPDDNGLSVLEKLKNSPITGHIPVIMLTAMGAEYDRIRGLDAGADDYIPKPFSIMEMIARVRAILRRTKSVDDIGNKPDKNSDTIQLGDLVLDVNKRLVLVQNKEVSLTLKEFELLHMLLSQKDVVFGRDKLLTKIWGYDYDGVSNRTVDVHIRTLRQKLGTCGNMIKTLRGVGYKISWSEERS